MAGALGAEEVGEGGVEAGAAEEVEERGGDIGTCGTDAAGIDEAVGGDGEGVGGGGGGAGLGGAGVDGVDGVAPVGDEQGWVDGVDVDWAVEVTAAGGVEGEVQGEVVAKVALDADGDLLDVGGLVVEVGGKAGGEDGEGEAAGEVALIDEDGGAVVGIEALLGG